MHTTEAPPSELSSIELLAKLLSTINGLRQALQRPPLEGLPVMPAHQSIQGWLGEIITAALGIQSTSIEDGYITVWHEAAETVREHLTDDGYVIAMASPDFKRLRPAQFIQEIIQRHQSRPILEVRHAQLMTASVLACVDTSNQDLFDLLTNAVLACDPSATVQLVDPEHNPDWLLKVNLQQLGASNISTQGVSLVRFDAPDKLFTAIEQAFGVPGMCCQEGCIYLAPWFQVLRGRLARGEMDLVLKS